MPHARITKRAVDALACTGREAYLWDDTLTGFGVRVSPSGHKTYIIRYRLPGRGRRANQRRVALGDHGTLTPDEARALAKRELGRVAQGFDPAADRARTRALPLVRELGEAYIEHVKARRKAGTAKEYERLWKKHVLPALGGRQVSAVTSADVRKIHRSLSETPYVANRSVALIGAFFTFAATEGARPSHDNPARGIELYTEKPHERFLTPEEFKRLGEALVRAETEGLPPAPEFRHRPKSEETAKLRPKSADKPIPANPYAVAAIRLLALTGCRENEILSLRWDAVDLVRGYLRLADTKTGRSVRPLGASAAAILQDLPRVDNNPFVIPGSASGQHLKDFQRLWHAVRHASNLKDVRLHDLRHSVASVPSATGESLLVLRSLLGHKRTVTTERYAHLGDDPVKRAADRASGDIARWLLPAPAGTPRTDESDVSSGQP